VIPAPPSRAERLAVLILTLALAATFAGLTTTTYTFAGDPEHYVGLARRIAAGQSYSVNGQPEVRFPPGFPLALSPAAWIGEGSFAVINRWSALLASLAFPLTWLYARKRVGWLGLPIALLTVGSVTFLTLATANPSSDPFYLAVSMALLLWAEREPPEATGRAWLWTLAGALLLIFLPAIRTVGVAALAGGAATFPRQNSAKWVRSAIPLVTGAIAAAAWFASSAANRVLPHSQSRGDSYLGYLVETDPLNPDLGAVSAAGLLHRLGRNLVRQVANMGELLSPAPWLKPVWYTPVLLIVPILLVGFWKEMRTGARFASLYCFFYLLIILGWPFDEGPRFLLPVVPLLWIYLVHGMRWVRHSLAANQARVRLFLVSLSGVALAGIALAGPPLSRQDLAAAGFWALVLGAAVLGWPSLRAWTSAHAPRRTRALTVGAVALFLAGASLQAFPRMYRRAYPAPGTVAHPGLEGAEWIRLHAPPDAMIQGTFPTRLNFVTGRPAVTLPHSRQASVHQEVQVRYRPRFAMVLDARPGDGGASDSVRFEIVRSLAAGHWHEVHAFPGGRIYQYR
jgi:hypothetical protein